MSPTPTLPWSHVEQRLHSASSTRTSSSGGCSCWRRTTWDPWTWKRRTRGNGRPNAGSASGGDGHTWTSTWGKNRDKIIRLNPKITDGRGSWRKCDGTDRCWGKWSPSAGCGGPGWSGRTNRLESGCCGRSCKTSVLTTWRTSWTWSGTRKWEWRSVVWFDPRCK